MFSNVLNATLRILLFRGGPQDLPFAPNLMPLLLAAAVLANVLLFGLLLPVGLAMVISVMLIASIGFSTRQVLRLRKLEPRFQQTYNALLATGTVLTLAQIPLMAQLAPEMLRVLQLSAQALEQQQQLGAGAAAGPLLPPQDMPQFSGPLVFLLNMLSFWNFAVQAYIFRQATEVSLWIGAFIALVVSMIALVFAVFGGSLIAAILGLAGPIAAT